MDPCGSEASTASKGVREIVDVDMGEAGTGWRISSNQDSICASTSDDGDGEEGDDVGI